MASTEPPGLGKSDVSQNPLQSLQDVNKQVLTQLKITQEEADVMNDLSREAMWKRSVPYSLGAMVGVGTLMKMGRLKLHPKWGPIPKVIGAGFVAWGLGRLSYIPTMQEEVLVRLPHSNLAASIRKARNMAPLEESPTPQWEPPANNKYLDTNPATEGIDDRFRPSLDREVNVDEPQETKKSMTYEDLRKMNRELYERGNQSQGLRVSEPTSLGPNPGPNDEPWIPEKNPPPSLEEPEAPPKFAPPPRKKRTNMWGDEIE